jgi:HKD family nuclease
MDVTVITSASAARKKLVGLVRGCDSMSFAVAWATPGPVVDEVLTHPRKVARLVIGTHRCVTDPTVLTACSTISSFRAMLPEGPLFHPKVYLFRTGDVTHAFVGSNNLTGNGFGKNIEAGVLLSGASSLHQFTSLETYIQDQWRRAHTIDETWITAYAANRRRTLAAAKEMERWIPVKPPRKKGRVKGPQALDWATFVEEIQKQDTHDFGHRLKVLSSARSLFGRHNSLADMSLPDRKRIAGTTTVKELEEDGFDWQYFGGMGSNGGFSSAVIKNPAPMSKALDAIPVMGDVTKAHYGEFVERFIRAFGGEPSYNKLGTGTRLLAMKRPDWFVGINGPNEADICDQFGVPASTTNLANYWERIIEPMQLTPWWRSSRPAKAFEREIWDGRAAMLDSLYYNEALRSKGK